MTNLIIALVFDYELKKKKRVLIIFNAETLVAGTVKTKIIIYNLETCNMVINLIVFKRSNNLRNWVQLNWSNEHTIDN